MKKYLISLSIIVLSIITGSFAGRYYLDFNSWQDKPVNLQGEVKNTLKENIVSQPKTIRIDKIGVNAALEYVGLDSQGKMDVPSKDENVAWYKLGAKPGERGSAVFAGHLDNVYGQPAVFWDLLKLQPGDRIVVTDSKNKEYTFIITDVQSYPYDQFPLQKVFNTNDKPRLNLITCGGVWNQSARNYSNREVVFSELKI